MSTEGEEKTHSLVDFGGFFELLTREGIESLVIGGCAVGAYAHLIGETVLSRDLDLFTDHSTLERIVDAARRDGARIRKLPRPRSIQVAVFDWREKEINVLTASVGLPGPATAARVAREFLLPGRCDLPILVADPFDLLANKLSVDRPKDRPHALVLRRFIEEEVVEAFVSAVDPRARIAPARRLLAATRARMLDEALSDRLLPLARTAPDFRFLMDCIPLARQAEALLALAPPAIADDLGTIRKRRRLK
ncbi:MAG: hypothetical protein EXR72_01550 [Myxococcales bacterium]|nr:hypothetical protein [Myxococcales bacterium]